MPYDVDIKAVMTGKTGKELYEFLYAGLEELNNLLCLEFAKNGQFRPIEWKVELGSKIAEIHHNSHTWCFTDVKAALKQINESKTPTYLGAMGHTYKAWQNNSLRQNEVVVEGISPVTHVTRKARLTVESRESILDVNP